MTSAAPTVCPAERRPTSAGQQWHAMAVRRLNRRHHVIDRAWNDHANRLDLVVRGIRAVEDPRDRVETNLSLDPLPQFILPGPRPRRSPWAGRFPWSWQMAFATLGVG